MLTIPARQRCFGRRNCPKLESVDTPETLNRSWQLLRFALDVLVLVLLAVCVVPDPQWRIITYAACFLAVYIAGSIGPIGQARHGNVANEVALTKPRGLLLGWLVILLLCWAALAFATLDASFLVFPLFFVILQVTGGLTAVIMVAATTATAIGAIAIHTPLTFGGVLGPILGGTFVLTVGLGFRLLQKETIEKTKALEELSAARAHSEALSRRAGELDERARLAADIHDTVAQGLSSIQLLLHSVESRMKSASTQHDQTSVDSLQLARKVAADNLAETRRIIAALQPAPLEGADLSGALEKVCSSTVLGDAVSFCVDGTPTRLPATVEATIIRVAQASLANVVKHAHATRCRVTLTYQPDEILLDCVDNGIGFDPTAPTNDDSVGIANARRRVEKLGGTFTIESEPGRGCGVSVSIPHELAS